MVYASKGNVDEAFIWLEKSFQDNEIELYWLKVEPEFESLYDDPRWQEMMDKVAEFYDNEVETMLAGLTSLIEPLLMVFVGMIIGTIVVAMFLPIFKMSEIVM